MRYIFITKTAHAEVRGPVWLNKGPLWKFEELVRMHVCTLGGFFSVLFQMIQNAYCLL